MTKLKLFIIGLIILGFGQQSLQAYDYIKAMTEGKNFYEIQYEANKYWDSLGVTLDSPKQKRGGLKPYKRWEYFWEQRVYPTGVFPSKAENWQAIIKEQKQNSSIKRQNGLQFESADYGWIYRGPKSAPGSYDGLGRINCVVEDPGYNGTTNRIIWVGTASGGLWKTTDAGTTWTTSTDDLGTLGIGDLIIEPDDANIMYLATGDGDGSDAMSLGVLKSTDGGNSWNTTGLNWTLNQTFVIRRLIMDPTNHQKLLAATSNGIYRTTDGGTTWSRRLSSSWYDIEYKPSDPSIAYAAWSSLIYKSTNGGLNWTVKTTGLPTTTVARITIAVSAAEPDNVYAEYGNTVDRKHKGFYCSTDAGETWARRDSASGETPKNLLGYAADGMDNAGQCTYDLTMTVNPNNADDIIVGGVNMWRSTDGGYNWNCVSRWTNDTPGISVVHADQHALYYGDGNENRLYSGNDGGLDISTDQGASWHYIGNGIFSTQVYRLGVCQTDTNRIIFGAQDNSSFILIGDNAPIKKPTGDGLESLIDYSNQNIMYTESYEGNWYRTTNTGTNWTTIAKPVGDDVGNWLTPYAIHPTNHNKIYIGYKDVYEWDFTRSGNKYVKISNWGVNKLDHIFISKSDPQYIYAGTKADMSYTSNGGTNWTALIKPVALSYTYLAINPTDPTEIWATFSGYTDASKIYHSTNSGTTWNNISGNLPNVPCNTVLYEPRTTKNRLYVGTDIGVYFKLEEATNWTKLDNKIPNVVVTELEIQDEEQILFAATYGRGVWKTHLPTLIAPLLATPLNTATNVPLATTLDFSSVSGADSYIVQLSDLSDFSNLIINETISSPTTEFSTTTQLGYSQTYYWRVMATDVSGEESPYSSVWSFTTESEPSITTFLDPIRIALVTKDVNTTATLQIDVLNANGTPVQWNSPLENCSIIRNNVSSGELGIISFVLDDNDLPWKNCRYNPNYLVRVTFNNVVVSIERLPVFIQNQGIFGPQVNSSLINPITTNSFESMIVNPGNVSIGTVGSEKLNITGNMAFSGALMPNNSAGSIGQFLTSRGAINPPVWKRLPVDSHYVGETFGGGIVFYVYDNGRHGLILGGSYNTMVKWILPLTNRYANASGDGLLAGQMNTMLVLLVPNAFDGVNTFAAKVVKDWSTSDASGTYTDWYLPSKYELNLLYSYKFAGGICPGFQNAYYWSSTENSIEGEAWKQDFNDGTQAVDSKSNTAYICPIRAF